MKFIVAYFAKLDITNKAPYKFAPLDVLPLSILRSHHQIRQYLAHHTFGSKSQKRLGRTSFSQVGTRTLLQKPIASQNQTLKRIQPHQINHCLWKYRWLAEAKFQECWASVSQMEMYYKEFQLQGKEAVLQEKRPRPWCLG